MADDDGNGRSRKPRQDGAAAVRVPPQDLEAEMGVLGSMMLDREAVGLVLQIIPREEFERFYRPDHQKLYSTLVDIYDTGRPMDLIVVRDELERRALLQEVGGIEYLTELVESVPSAAHAEHYAEIVRDKSLLRDLIRTSGEIADQAYEHRESAQTLLDNAESRLFEVTEKRIRNQVVSIRTVLKQAFESIKTGGHHVSGITTGFTELNDLTSGFQPGELIIIAARPSMGKTALGLSMAEGVGVDDGRAVAFFSMEMSRQQIAQRMLCSRGEVDSHKMRRGMLSESEIAHLGLIAGDLESKPIFIDDTPGMSVMELRAKARRLRMLHKIEVVYIDYLQLMTDPATARESRQHEIATISRGLKALARQLEIPVVALAQLNRNPEGREGNRPRMSDLRESGAIEQDADMVILLHREEYYKPNDPDLKGKAELIIAKQRNGPVGNIELQFNHKFTKFRDLYQGPDLSQGAYTPAPAAEDFGGSPF